jgi:F-box-like
MSTHQYVSICSIAEVTLTYGATQHRFSLRNCYPSFVAARVFSPRTIIATVNATICHLFSKAQRMWDGSPVCRKKRRSQSLHHDNPSVVPGSSHGEQIRRIALTRVDISCSGTDDLGRHMTIDILPDDVLLEIFDHHRLAAQEYELFGPWEWHRLAHVCQSWRSVVFASPRRLNLRLVYTYKKPVRKDLDCWPPSLPISIWYPRLVLYHPLSPTDEANVISALEFPGRICEINLTLTRTLLEKLTPLMQDPFPALEYLTLGSRDLMESLIVPSGVVPSGFLGGFTPRLRHIDLDGTPFPTLPLLLLSASDLAFLRLHEIPNTGYFSPEALVAGLTAKSDLKFVDIHFRHPSFDLGLERPRPRPNSPTRVLLPALTEFQFWGDNAYLENLIARIDAPNIERFGITLFEQRTFELPQLAEFIGRTEKLKSSPYRTSIWFWDRGFSITHYFGPPSSGPTFRLETSCHGLAWQVTLLSRICKQLSLLISRVERLDIETDHVLSYTWDEVAGSDSDPDSDSDRDSDSGSDSGSTRPWLELLAPFHRVRRLELIGTPAPSIASALEKSASGNGCREVLPSLRSLHLRGPAMPRPIESFVAARQRSGHVVSVHFEGDERPVTP